MCCVLETALHLCVCENWAAKGRRFHPPPWWGSRRMCGTAMEMKIISDNQRGILELAALSDKGFFLEVNGKIGPLLFHRGTFPCLQPSACTCLSSNRHKKKKCPVKTMNLCQKTRNLTDRATVVRKSRDRLAESPRRSVLGIARRERWPSPLQGSTAAALSPITNTEGTFLTATTSDAGNKTFTWEKTLSKPARPSSLSSKRSGQENKQAHSL